MSDLLSPSPLSLSDCRVICVGVNPAFDLTLTLDGLDGDRVNRVLTQHRQAAGKAANVACALSAAGVPTGLIGFYGEENAEEWARLFALRCNGAVRLEMLLCPGATRQNMTLLTGGRTVKINMPGCEARDTGRLAECLAACAEQGCKNKQKTAVFTGSLPPGLSAPEYAELVAGVSGMGMCTALDIDGLTRQQIITARPWLYKPNAHELAKLTGASAADDDALMEQAQLLVREGVGTVLLTLGERGLAAVSAEETVRIQPGKVTAVNTVGAGDAALAAFIAAKLENRSLRECAQAAARAGEQAVTREF